VNTLLSSGKSRTVKSCAIHQRESHGTDAPSAEPGHGPRSQHPLPSHACPTDAASVQRLLTDVYHRCMHGASCSGFGFITYINPADSERVVANAAQDVYSLDGRKVCMHSLWQPASLVQLTAISDRISCHSGVSCSLGTLAHAPPSLVASDRSTQRWPYRDQAIRGKENRYVELGCSGPLQLWH
jgi:hypothetical protein